MRVTLHSTISCYAENREWDSMKAVWDACAAAGVDAPDEVTKFFNGEEPVRTSALDPTDAVTATPDGVDAKDGMTYEVRIDKLPAGAKLLVFNAKITPEGVDP
jgi:hypothetical protein